MAGANNIKITYTSVNGKDVREEATQIKNILRDINKSDTKVTMRDTEVKSLVELIGSLKVKAAMMKEEFNSLSNQQSKAAKQIKSEYQGLENFIENITTSVSNMTNVSKNVIKEITSAGSLELQKMSEDASKAMAKSIKDKETEVDKLRTEIQSAMRQIADAQNLNKKGSKTGLDIAHLQRRIMDIMKKFEELREVLTDDNQAIQHFLDGVDFTKINNELRATRDEAVRMANEIPKMAKDLEKLKIDPDKNEAQINKLENDLKSYKAQLESIISVQKEFYNSKAAQYGIPEKERQEGIAALDTIKERCTWLEKEKVEKQQVVNIDKLSEQQYKQLKQQIQEIHSLEIKLEKLKKDKKGNRNEIQVVEELIAKKKEEYQIEEKISKLTGNRRKEVEKLNSKQEEAVRIIRSQNEETSKLGEKLKNMVTYLGMYKVLGEALQAVQKSIDTMKELDAAFTDIRLVTGGTKEETAQLAKEYNNLAKEMGSTTVEVANGAGEWFNESRDH